MQIPRVIGVLALCAIALPRAASAQTSGQLWGTATLNWLKTDRLTYELEFEPKVAPWVPEGDPRWASVDFTPNVEYALRSWLDILGEVATSYTWQDDDVTSTELSPRAGARFHFLSRELPTGPLKREHLPRHRIVVRDLVRVEGRNLFYNDGTQDSVIRFRNRLELQVPLNRPKVSDDGARYFLIDWEWFIPLDDPEERFASRQRVRAGLGYRHTRDWRFEVLYILNRSRNTLEEGFQSTDSIVDIRFKRVF
jgi:hypothetical protein